MTLALVDIGDKLRLTQDWTFQLHQESRNHEFAVALGLLAVDTPWDTIMHRIGMVTEKNYYQTRPFPEEERYYFERALRRKHGLNEYRGPALEGHRLSEFDRGTLELMAAFTLHATIPAGAELTVDRVYIRKGAKDYSSLSFLVTDAAPFGDRLAPVAKRGFKREHRFWAKLDDCRRMDAVLTYAEVAA